MLETIGYDEVGHAQDYVVARNLVESVLIELDVRCLVFYNHLRLGMQVVEYGVAAFGGLIQRERYFVGQ